MATRTFRDRQSSFRNFTLKQMSNCLQAVSIEDPGAGWLEQKQLAGLLAQSHTLCHSLHSSLCFHLPELSLWSTEVKYCITSSVSRFWSLHESARSHSGNTIVSVKEATREVTKLLPQ